MNDDMCSLIRGRGVRILVEIFSATGKPNINLLYLGGQDYSAQIDNISALI